MVKNENDSKRRGGKEENDSRHGTTESSQTLLGRAEVKCEALCFPALQGTRLNAPTAASIVPGMALGCTFGEP